MVQISTAEFAKGGAIMYQGEPCIIIDLSHKYLARGSAHYKVKLRNLKTGRVNEVTFKSGEKVNQAEIGVSELQYLYNDGNAYYFMHPVTFEQVELERAGVGDFAKYIKEGEAYQVYMFEDKPIAMRPPAKVKLKVVESSAGAKGNTATAATKTVTLETGVKVNVPLFIKEGDSLIINTDSGEYVSRG